MLKKIFLRKQQVGELGEDGVFITKRDPIHFFRDYNGFGMSYDLLINLKRQGCKYIIILYNSGYKIEKLTTSIDKFLNDGEIYRNAHDFQRILSMSQFNQKKLKEFGV